MEYSEAREFAEALVKGLSPFCERIEIAGSIRREKPDVGDIEIVAAPILKPPRPVFGDRKVFRTALDRALFNLEFNRKLAPVKGGEKYKQYWVLKGGGVHVIKLDLFLVTPPAQWGVIDLIRTGPHDFSQWMVTPRSQGGALPDEYRVKDGCIWRVLQPAGPDQDFTFVDSDPIPMAEEADFFTLCGMEWIEPSKRQATWQHHQG